MLWRIEFGAGEMSNSAVGYEVSSGDQYLPVGKQRRGVKFANIVHVPGASDRPGVGRRVVETGVACNAVLFPPSSDLSLSGAEQRQRVADSGRGHIELTGPRPSARDRIVELAGRAG